MCPHCLQEEGQDVKGLRFERLGRDRHYNVIFHIGSSYVPVSDDTIEELKSHTLLSSERFLELLVDKIGYSSYLKAQIRSELQIAGGSDDPDHGPPRRHPRIITPVFLRLPKR